MEGNGLIWLIDTDIGDDIDDAIALQYLCNAGMNIAAVCTVYRNSLMRAKLARRLLALSDRGDIPVYAGIDQPFVNKVTQDPKRWLSEEEYAKLGPDSDWLPHYLPGTEGERVEDADAVDAIIRYAEEYERRLCVLAIGPLTNLAMAIRKKPPIRGGIREIMLMGGTLEDIAEWNFKLDPEAAHIVLNSKIPVRMVGCDITWKYCTLTAEEFETVKDIFEKQYPFICRMLQKWTRQPLYVGKNPCLHDVIPAADIIEGDILRFEKKNVRLGLSGDERAKVLVEEGDGPTVQVAVSADRQKFMDSFFRYIKKGAHIEIDK